MCHTGFNSKLILLLTKRFSPSKLTQNHKNVKWTYPALRLSGPRLARHDGRRRLRSRSVFQSRWQPLPLEKVLLQHRMHGHSRPQQVRPPGSHLRGVLPALPWYGDSQVMSGVLLQEWRLPGLRRGTAAHPRAKGAEWHCRGAVGLRGKKNEKSIPILVDLQPNLVKKHSFHILYFLKYYKKNTVCTHVSSTAHLHCVTTSPSLIVSLLLLILLGDDSEDQIPTPELNKFYKVKRIKRIGHLPFWGSRFCIFSVKRCERDKGQKPNEREWANLRLSFVLKDLCTKKKEVHSFWTAKKLAPP